MASSVCKECKKEKKVYEYKNTTIEVTSIDPEFKSRNFPIAGRYRNNDNKNPSVACTLALDAALLSWSLCCAANFPHQSCPTVTANCPCDTMEKEFAMGAIGMSCAGCQAWIDDNCKTDEEACGDQPVMSDVCDEDDFDYYWNPATATVVWKITPPATPSNLEIPPPPPDVDTTDSETYTPTTYGRVNPHCAYTGPLDCATVPLPTLEPGPTEPAGDSTFQNGDIQCTYTRSGILENYYVWEPIYPEGVTSINGWDSVADSATPLFFTYYYDWTGELHVMQASASDQDCHYCS